MKTLNLFLAFLLLSQGLSAQTTESGDLVATIGTIIDNLPGDTGDDYVPPTNAQLTIWESCLLNLVPQAADFYTYSFSPKTTLDGFFFASLRTEQVFLVEKMMVLR